ncbi:MAG TPA: hypothetical protein EYP53_05865, partial [Candidatus Latescibacteria bacterium]|nr:hypothetical protein [Candidatus Latescibacterota bacterium]
RSLVLAMLVASFAFSFTMASLIMLGFSTGLAAPLGAIASSSAPVLVFGRDRDGSLKGGILLYVTSAGTAVSLLIWIIALAKIDLFGNGEVAAWERITRPVLGTIILVAIGLFWGWMLDRFCSAIGSPSTIVLLILGMLFIGYVVSKDLVGDPLILGVACGLFVGNRSKRAERITGSTESVSRMALILLFGLFGAQINLKALFTSSSILWPPAIIYILAMVGGKAAGAVIGLRLLKIKDIRPLYLLSGVSCQAIVTSSLLIATQPRLAGTQYRQDIIAVATLGIILGSLVFPAVMGSETSGLKAVKA